MCSGFMKSICSMLDCLLMNSSDCFGAPCNINPLYTSIIEKDYNSEHKFSTKVIN